jgi:hypothetical protein
MRTKVLAEKTLQDLPQIRQYVADLLEYETYEAVEVLLKQLTIDAVEPMYITDLSDEQFEFAAVTTKEILAELETYAIITSHRQPLRLAPETKQNTYTAGATD